MYRPSVRLYVCTRVPCTGRKSAVTHTHAHATRSRLGRRKISPHTSDRAPHEQPTDHPTAPRTRNNGQLFCPYWRVKYYISWLTRSSPSLCKTKVPTCRTARRSGSSSQPRDESERRKTRQNTPQKNTRTHQQLESETNATERDAKRATRAEPKTKGPSLVLIEGPTRFLCVLWSAVFANTAPTTTRNRR